MNESEEITERHIQLFEEFISIVDSNRDNLFTNFGKFCEDRKLPYVGVINLSFILFLNLQDFGKWVAGKKSGFYS